MTGQRKISFTCEIWNWLKDNPNKTSLEISSAFNVKANRVSSILSQLRSRGMVEAHKERVKEGKLNSPGFLLVHRALGSKYKLKPIKYGARSKLVKYKPVEVKPVKNEPVTRSKITLEDVSVVEAKDLYEQLKKIFG